MSKGDLETRFTQMKEFLGAFKEYDLISKHLQKENILIHEVFLLFCKAMEHTNHLIGEFDSGKLQFLGEDNPFIQLYNNFHCRFFEEDLNWSNFLIESTLLNGKLGESNWFPDEQKITAARNKEVNW